MFPKKPATLIKEILKTLWPAIVLFLGFKSFAALYAPAPINPIELEQALGSGQPVLLEFHASWCTTCLIQRNTLRGLLNEGKFAHIKRFTINFDQEVEIESRFGVRSQSTLILIKSNREVARSIGLTRNLDLREFMERVL